MIRTTRQTTKGRGARLALWALLPIATLSLFPAVGCSLFGIRTYEQAGYEVTLEDGAFELRDYERLIIAETVADGSYDDSSSAAFRRLFNYISGENEASEKVSMTAPVYQQRAGEEISMTAPVLQEKQEGDEAWKMAFVLPEKYTMETASRPTHPEVELREIPPRTVAAIRFSGSLTESKIADHTEKLERWIEEKGYQARSAPRSAGYDPPWTIPFLRRNEVLIEVE